MGNIILPKSVDYILKQLNASGYESYVVGGCVRDSLIGLSPHDWDICTSALPEQVIEVFGDYKIIPTGLKHGTVTIIIDEEGFEVTTYRIDGEYKNHRHPKNVKYTKNLCEDLMRRDFTMNAMAYNPTNGIIDIVGGVNDIEYRTIRCVGNADMRFKEDALRVLRAIRFAVKYSFSIESYTKAAILNNNYLLKHISMERINAELSKILSCRCDNTEHIYLLMLCLEKAVPILCKLFISDESKVYISKNISLASPNVYLRLALLFNLDNEYEIFDILKTLKFDNITVKNSCNINKYGKYIIDNYSNIVIEYFAKWLIKNIGDKNAILSTEFASIIQPECKNTMLELKEYILKEIENNSCCNISQMDINGNDLIKIGFSGKEIGDCLAYMLDEIMQNKLKNCKDDLLKRAKKIKENEL